MVSICPLSRGGTAPADPCPAGPPPHTHGFRPGDRTSDSSRGTDFVLRIPSGTGTESQRRNITPAAGNNHTGHRSGWEWGLSVPEVAEMEGSGGREPGPESANTRQNNPTAHVSARGRGQMPRDPQKPKQRLFMLTPRRKAASRSQGGILHIKAEMGKCP